MSKRSSVLQLTLGGIFAALICIATMFFQIPVSLTHGYIHLGDALILLCASLLGWIAVPAAAEADPSLAERQPFKAAASGDLGWLGQAVDKHYAGDDSDLPF